MGTILFAAYQGGAANLLEPVAQELMGRGHGVRRLACGPAKEVWRKADATFDRSPDDNTPLTEVLNRLRPDLVVSGTTAVVDFEKLLWPAARELAIPTIGVIDSWMNVRERLSLCNGDGLSAPDALCVIDEEMKAALEADKAVEARLYVTGQPYLERLCKRIRLARPGRPRTGGAPTLVFMSEPMNSKLGKRRPGFDPVGVAGMLLECLEKHGPLTLLIKPHPRESQRIWFHWLANNEAVPGVSIRLTDRPAETLLEEVDAVVGLSSITLVAAGLAGVPVLALQPRRTYVPNRKLDAMQEVPVVTDPAAVPDAIAALLGRISTGRSRNPAADDFAGSIDRVIEVITSELERGAGAAEPGADVATDPNDRLDLLFDALFPICRSITGPGLRDSLDILARPMPLEIEEVASGTKVFDWTVPQEWRIRSARLTGPNGEVLADFERCNLEVVNYSAPVDGRFTLEQLRPHLHSIERLPDAIPYVTSYYNREWGFCLPYKTFECLPEGAYTARIDSEFVDGAVNFGHCMIAGETRGEILLSSYLCHPSLANNELGGPLVLVELHRRIRRWKRRRFTYRFVLNPETIGSLCYLYRHGERLRSRMVSGMVVTCIGGPGDRLSYKLSRGGDSLLDRTVIALDGAGIVPIDIRPFDPTFGSDERQYCSPGFNLPMGQMARMPYTGYDGYHNSLDTKDYMGIDRLIDSADKIERLLTAVETAGRFENLSPHGEPQLGRRGLYPTINTPTNRNQSSDDARDGRVFLDRVLYVLNYADGEHDMLDIAEKCGCSVLDLAPVIETLEQHDLLRMVDHGDGR